MMVRTNKKTTVEHLEKLISFYETIETNDKNLKKLIVRNLKDVKKRAEKEELEWQKCQK